MSGNFYETYSGMVNRIASEFARKFIHSEKEDVEQTLWLWFASHPVKTKEWMELENPKDSDKLFAKSLRNAAMDYCLREKAAKEGYDYDDVFWYNKSFVKLLLPAVLADDYSRLQNVLAQHGGRGSGAPAEANDWMAYSSDIRAAYSKLTEEEQKLVYLFYAKDVEGSELHEVAGDDKPSARATMMQANRALNKMVKNLGGFEPFKDDDEVESKEDDL